MNPKGVRGSEPITRSLVVVLIALQLALFSYDNMPGKRCQAGQLHDLAMPQRLQEQLSRQFQTLREQALKQLRQMGYDVRYLESEECCPHLRIYSREPAEFTGWALVINDRRDKFYPMEQFASSLRCFPELRYLNVRTDECWDDSLGDLIVQACPEVRWLDLPVIGLKTAKQLTTLKSLEVVKIRGYSSEDKISDELLHYLARIPNLRVLTIGTVQGNLTLKGLRELTKAPRLEVLSLDLDDEYKPTYRGPGVPPDPPKPDPVVPDRVFHEMADILVAMPRLKSLSLTIQHGFDSRMDDRFVAKLSKSRTIRKLCFSPGKHRRITDESASYLAQMQQLEVLEIRYSGISDEGVKHLAALPNLRELDLFGAKAITDQSVAAFCQMKNLIFLEVTDTGMSKAARTAVMEHVRKNREKLQQ